MTEISPTIQHFDAVKEVTEMSLKNYHQCWKISVHVSSYFLPKAKNRLKRC